MNIFVKVPPIFLPIFFVSEIILIFFLSQKTLNEIFYFLRKFFKNEKLVYSLVSLIFLPGTIVHELSHYGAATVLGLKVIEVKIFPVFEKNQIKLGSVIYGKKDVFRSILVGIAPLFFSLFCFWLIGKFNLFPTKNIWLNIFFTYFIFTVSLTMFSSKQDLIDLIYLLPLGIIIGGVIYIFDLKEIIFNNQIVNSFLEFVSIINLYLIVSISTNIVLIIFFKSFQTIFKK
ncbi:MAG: hypothetical protein N2482_01165 [Patescibacteria group bacterium]|nr:hypothetical protein [Patescibacteria group bacterium]